jgi:hypothetical protein
VNWRRRPPAHVENVVGVPLPRDGVPDRGPTEGELARVKAELALSDEIERTAVIRSETPYFAGVGIRLARIYERNHIREDVLSAALRSLRGGS